MELARCTKCGEEKSRDDFHADRTRKNGLHPQCKACAAAYHREHRRETSATRAAAWRRKHPERAKTYFRNYQLKRRYGFSLIEYEKMILDQGNQCAICQSDNPGGPTGSYFSVDHCHETGKIRELLCMRCNTSIGQFEDDPNLLRKAADYLEKHENVG